MASCKVYKQDIMFKIDEESLTKLSEAVYDIEKNYVVQKNDFLSLNLFTNKGERIVDPIGGVGIGAQQNMQNMQRQQQFSYLVQQDGSVKFPVIDLIFIEGYTILEAESIVQDAYDEYYKDSFVKIEFENKRVVVLGGAGNVVIPLENENISLLEVLALAGGVAKGDKVQNIKIIRGDLTNPQIYAIDLTTIDGMRNSIISLQPGDIVYVEPWRRVWVESLRDVAPILSILTSLLTLSLVIQRI